jgi:hypothetical protein
MKNGVLLLLLPLILILQGCFCFCDKKQLVKYEFFDSKATQLQSFERAEIDTTLITFNLEIANFFYSNPNEVTQNVKMAGLMQPCECYAENIPEYDIIDIKVITLNELSSGYPAGSDVSGITEGKQTFYGSPNTNFHDLRELIELSHSRKFNLFTGDARQGFQFVINEKPRSGKHQLEVIFTFRNGKQLETLSPEFEFN